MDSRRATIRNVRSKCRCSCVLQFTFRRAVSCVLHRPPSQVIHCTVLSFSIVSSHEENSNFKRRQVITSHHGEGLIQPGQGRKLLGRFDISSQPEGSISGVPYPRPRPPASQSDLDGRQRPAGRLAKSRRARGTRNPSCEGLPRRCF
jgi:hypothetical protein